jgi:hypothetical protein
MTTQVVKENALTEDLLHVADTGKVFSGNYEAILEYYTYANEWGDKKHIRRFRTLENARKYILKNYA